ncbi:hypothetical protein [Sphingomonas prati]|uniref:Uncharacterized protein n=1 Tax=Sphingomonas prati TaxID=1843237 RepID=A0A7W9BQS3_9SPHN|nr:hypothetical protein [Sphingomonas prati]MBB5728290.1 hypothetical protein [Sphingomonas prati]
MTEKCNRCRFWQVDGATAVSGNPDEAFGSCRRHPPVIVDAIADLLAGLLAVGSYQTSRVLPTDQLAQASRQPATRADDWCGHFELPPHRNPANLPIC